MSRNRGRVGNPKTGATTQDGAPPPDLIDEPTGSETANATFSFVVPTEFVDLPSEGKYYPANHPLHGCDTLEIRQMTAKEEDMLTSRSLIKKGVAVDRVLQSIIVDRRVNADSLLIGDRNALIVAARCSGYGSDYETSVTCPDCGTVQKYAFDLNEAEILRGATFDVLEATDNNDGTFDLKLPVTELTVTFRLLTGADERRFLNSVQKGPRSKNKRDAVITTQLRNLIVAVNGDSSQDAINYLIQNIPSRDSRRLRNVYKLASPDIDLTQHFECDHCDYTNDMEVPLTADFFWPDR